MKISLFVAFIVSAAAILWLAPVVKALSVLVVFIALIFSGVWTMVLAFVTYKKVNNLTFSRCK